MGRIRSCNVRASPCGVASGYGRAWAVIHAGHHLVPEAERSLFHRHQARDFGLPPRMYYRQSAMFVAYLKARSPTAFTLLLGRLFGHGEAFGAALARAYPMGAARLWADFVAQGPQAA